MKLTIYGEDTIEFVPPFLIDLGPVREALSGESFSMSVRLDNVRGYVTSRLNPPPLRAKCLIEFDGIQVPGIVQAVTLAEEATIRIET